MADTHRFYMYHLDAIRAQKNIKVKDFCEGICSDRHYRRLINGEQNVSEDKLILFCDRLQISPSDFFYSYHEKDRQEYKKLQTLYIALSKNDFERYNQIVKTVREERFLNRQNERFYSYISLKHAYVKRLEQEQYIIDKLSQICDYPSCKNHNAFDFVDIVSLLLISEIQINFGKVDALAILQRVLLDTSITYISSESRHILPSIYGTVAVLLSRNEQHKEALDISNKGISFSILHSNNNSLTHLYYIKAYSLLLMGQRKEAEIAAARCLSNALAKQSSIEYQAFYKTLKKDFNMDPSIFLTTLLKHNTI